MPPSPLPPASHSGPVPVPSPFFIAQGFRAESMDAARRWGAAHDDRHHPHDWTAIHARRIGTILARFDFIRSIEGQRDRAFEETISLRRQLVKLGGVVLSWITALADVAQLLAYLRERRSCPHDPGRLVFCSRCEKLATLRHAREAGRYLCDAHAQGLDPADLEGAAGCFQAPRVAALLEAADKSRGVRITTPYYGPPERS